MFVVIHRSEVERVLRANGFPTASMGSDSGPAPKVLAKLILYFTGVEVDSLTIARDWRKFNQRRGAAGRDG